MHAQEDASCIICKATRLANGTIYGPMVFLTAALYFSMNLSINRTYNTVDRDIFVSKKVP